MKALITLWKFSRPHTIIGSVIGIYTFFAIIYDQQHIQSYYYLTMALIIAITCNVFIVGINQVADVNINLKNLNSSSLLIFKSILISSFEYRIAFCIIFPRA